MSTVFHYFTLKSIPQLSIGQKVESKRQLALPVSDNAPCTTLERLGQAEDDAFDKYFIVHQVEQQVDGIYQQQPMHRFLENKRFPLFVHRQAGYLLAETSKPYARGALRRLEEAKHPLEADTQEIDLGSLQDLGSTTGGWFGELRIADVSAAGLFGSSTVSESAEWQRYLEEGKLNALLMKLIDEGGAVKSFMVTRERVVVLHRDEGEAENLRYARYLQETIDSALGDS